MHIRGDYPYEDAKFPRVHMNSQLILADTHKRKPKKKDGALRIASSSDNSLVQIRNPRFLYARLLLLSLMRNSLMGVQWKEGKRHTPLIIRVPILVTKPLTLSDRNDDRASVEPGSFGASKATHSCSPFFRDARFSCSRFRSHSSSQAYNASIF